MAMITDSVSHTESVITDYLRPTQAACSKHLNIVWKPSAEKVIVVYHIQAVIIQSDGSMLLWNYDSAEL